MAGEKRECGGRGTRLERKGWRGGTVICTLRVTAHSHSASLPQRFLTGQPNTTKHTPLLGATARLTAPLLLLFRYTRLPLSSLDNKSMPRTPLLQPHNFFSVLNPYQCFPRLAAGDHPDVVPNPASHHVSDLFSGINSYAFSLTVTRQFSLSLILPDELGIESKTNGV